MLTLEFLTCDKTETGAAYMTVFSPDAHFTYRVKTKENKYGAGMVHFVSLLTGPDNERNYTYIGMIRGVGQSTQFVLTQASKLKGESRAIKAFRFALDVLARNRTIPAGYGLRHEGRCGRCGRKLTTPESIDTGFGPECASVLGLTWEKSHDTN